MGHPIFTGVNIQPSLQFHPWEKIINGEVVDYDSPDDDNAKGMAGMGLRHD